MGCVLDKQPCSDFLLWGVFLIRKRVQISCYGVCSWLEPSFRFLLWGVFCIWNRPSYFYCGCVLYSKPSL